MRTLRRVATAAAAAMIATVATPVMIATATAAAASPIVMSVDSVSPSSPVTSGKPTPVTFRLTLTNSSSSALRDVQITGVRSDPIGSASQLERAFTHVQPPSEGAAAPISDTTVKVTVPADGSAVTAFRTTMDTTTTDSGICQCDTKIYPVYFTAAQVASDGTTTELAHAQTYLPSFKEQDLQQLAKMRVGWLWPLLDRPHRIIRDQIFTNDDLTAEVSPGGRLDRMLDVAERVAARGVALTIVTDPELIDELAVMASGYRVATSKGATVAGTGGTAAAQWLARLRQVLAAPKMEIAFTAYADPDVDSMTSNGLTWRTSPSSAISERVTTALGGRLPSYDVTWPIGQALHASTLATLVKQGTSTVVLADKLFPQLSGVSPVPSALAPVRTRNGAVVAAVTSTTLERTVRDVLHAGSSGLALLPKLIARLAIRVVTNLQSGAYVLLTPPRLVHTVDPGVAAAMIEATAQSQWSTPSPLQAAADSLPQVDHGAMHGRAGSAGLPTASVEALKYVTSSMTKLANLYYRPSSQTTSLLAALPGAVQRCTSVSLVADDSRSTKCAQYVAKTVRSIREGVHVVPPSGGSTYTLTSRSSKLPVTITNTLDSTVQVRVHVGTVDQVPGLSTDDLKSLRIRANSTVQVHVDTHVERVGLIQVQVTLSTDNGLALGDPRDPVRLNIRSTALGTIGVIITIVAGAVLVLALVIRAGLRLRSRRRAAGA